MPHLASGMLGRVLPHLSADLQSKYGHPILRLESFVEGQRFAETSYEAANWLPLGSTVGRNRQGQRHTLQVSVKDVYVYPLVRRFRAGLSA